MCSIKYILNGGFSTWVQADRLAYLHCSSASRYLNGGSISEVHQSEKDCESDNVRAGGFLFLNSIRRSNKAIPTPTELVNQGVANVTFVDVLTERTRFY